MRHKNWQGYRDIIHGRLMNALVFMSLLLADRPSRKENIGPIELAAGSYEDFVMRNNPIKLGNKIIRTRTIRHFAADFLQ